MTQPQTNQPSELEDRLTVILGRLEEEVINRREAKAEILAILSTSQREARIDELKKLPVSVLSPLYKHTGEGVVLVVPEQTITKRIAALTDSKGVLG